MLPLLCAVGLSGCGESPNPPHQPADPVAEAPTVNPTAPVRPGAGPDSFVGLWAADAAWCVNVDAPTDQRPIRITTERFEGYENHCDIEALHQAENAYAADLICQAEGQTVRERIRLRALANTLRITWLDRDGAVSDFVRCDPAVQE